ncbi:hypothetical protein BLL42_23585 [Pseudomonas frederiksbergensis]|uniref:Uncharacterized protein n=1 Tax=Pseudomonas frederiksbergensis TaxID=104087 RepID=A0A1J0ESS2_9PSED|nr:hypothetical protein BLL42_01810 [Pseudomonas frederiksbergensis]APC19331.1 hypothetical protein BLL42_23585 [Pseudomonas frederiksbergensis]
MYQGPQSAACLRVEGSAELLDVQLLTGKPVELPADHEYTLVLLALKHLVLAPAETEPKSTPKPKSAAPVDSPLVTEHTGAKPNAR